MKRSVAPARPGRWAALSLGLVATWVTPASAQEETAEAVAEDSVVASDSLPGRPGPSGAFLRGAIIPGWGHAASGSLTRGAFYFGIEAASGWMVFKSWRKLRVARRQLAVWEDRVTAQLMLEEITEPDDIETRLAQDEEIAQLRELVDARSEQREDWAAVSIFFLLMSGVDAFVSAHLRDFPDPLTVEGDPGGTVSLTVRIPVG